MMRALAADVAGSTRAEAVSALRQACPSEFIPAAPNGPKAGAPLGEVRYRLRLLLIARQWIDGDRAS